MATLGAETGIDAGQVVIYADQEFRSLHDVTAYIESIEPANRYDIQTEILERMVAFHGKAGDMIEEMYHYVRSSGAYKAKVTEDEFTATWAGVIQIILDNRKRRDRFAEAKAAILKHWDTSRAVGWVKNTGGSASFLAAVRHLAINCAFPEAVLKINHSMVERLSRTARGISTAKSVITGDVNNARKNGVALPVPTGRLVELGLRIGRYGLLEEDDGSMMEIEDGRDGGEHGECEEDRTPQDGPVGIASHAGTPVTASISRAANTPDLTRPAGEIDCSTLTVEEAAEFRIPDAEQDPLNEQAIVEAENELQEYVRSPVDQDSGDEDGEDEDGEQLDSDGGDGEPRPSKRRRIAEDGGSGVHEGPSLSRHRVGGCRCSGDVTHGWKKAVMKKRALGLVADMRLLAKHQSFSRVCFAHSKAMGSHIGLMMKKLNGQTLPERLRMVHENRLSLGKLKTDPETYRWFRIANRPPRPSDNLGPYKFAPVAPTKDFVYDQTAVMACISSKLQEEWLRDGSVNVGIFGWWFQGPIGDIILAEFEMYRHHLREINGKSNFGWLRSMFYSIGQQLMRQDPVYYMLYAALRPDKQWRLVSYPYYAKYAVKGDLTYFRHLDLNIPQLISSARGASMIQGSVSLDDEDESNCTVILAGMQNRLAEWWARCKARGQDTDGFVHRITEAMFTREDVAALGIDWKKVPCARGDARVTLPHLPHGADGPSTGTRRTMLPWFVGLQDDLETLEVIEGGTWSELSEAHRDLVSPKATPSGLANRYGAIPYRFPAAVELSGLGGLSDALVCRRRWDSPTVLRDRDLLLSGEMQEISRYVQAWRQRAEEAAIEAFEMVMEEERRMFGDKSYFHHKARFDNYGIPIPDVEPDQDELDQEEVAQDRTVAMSFAEEGMDEESDGGTEGGADGGGSDDSDGMRLGMGGE